MLKKIAKQKNRLVLPPLAIRGKTPDFLVLALILLALALAPGHASALANPDEITIELAARYDDVATPGDMFVLVEYDILYDVIPALLPDETISQGWVARLIDVGGAGQLASLHPYSGGSIPNLGYSRGAYGFYFAVKPTITGTLRVTLEGDPGIVPHPAGVFVDGVPEREASELAPDLRSLALRMEDIWDVDLVSPLFGGVNRYTVEGEEYFASALPNLRNVAPDLFILQSTVLDTPDRDFDTAYADERIALFDGTIINTGMESGAQALNMSETMFRFVFAFVFAIIVAFFIGRFVGFQDAWYLQISAVYLVMMAGFWIGLVTAPVLGIITVIALLATITVFFLQRTNA